jgi:hypothetical protein
MYMCAALTMNKVSINDLMQIVGMGSDGKEIPLPYKNEHYVVGIENDNDLNN